MRGLTCCSPSWSTISVTEDPLSFLYVGSQSAKDLNISEMLKTRERHPRSIAENRYVSKSFTIRCITFCSKFPPFPANPFLRTHTLTFCRQCHHRAVQPPFADNPKLQLTPPDFKSVLYCSVTIDPRTAISPAACVMDSILQWHICCDFLTLRFSISTACCAVPNLRIISNLGTQSLNHHFTIPLS